MTEPKDETFLKIISGEIPSYKLYEDEHTCAFLSIGPNNPGHALVVPKVFSENIYNIDQNSLTHTILTVQKIAKLLKETLGCDGINIIQNNERAAGQAVFHIHFHVIPRYENDGLHNWSAKELTEVEFKQVQAKIVAGLK